VKRKTNKKETLQNSTEYSASTKLCRMKHSTRELRVKNPFISLKRNKEEEKEKFSIKVE